MLGLGFIEKEDNMSTSCIIALKQGEDIVLLEKKRDGFEESVRVLLNNAVAAEGLDCEYIANWLIKNTDIQFSLFIHKYPWLLIIFQTFSTSRRENRCLHIGRGHFDGTLVRCEP